jgi:MFS family permease
MSMPMFSGQVLTKFSWFLGGPIADRLGRKWGMAIGCILTIIATFLQTFSKRGSLAMFIVGRVIIGIGQGIALSRLLRTLFAP